MWNRDTDREEDEDAMDRSETGTDASAKAGRRDRTSSGRQAIIGESITIEGELAGSEDLTIQGNVQGSVNLDDHAVTVGPDGKVEADIVARVITVEGHVVGDLDADDQIVLRGSARVEGDLSAPRVNLEDGSYFRGAVDMGEKTSGGGGRSSSSGASGGSSFSSTSSSGKSSSGKSSSKKGDGSKEESDGEDTEADDAA